MIHKRDKNQLIADRLDAMDLSEKARCMIEQTGFNFLHDLFGDCSESDIEELANYIMNKED